MLRKKLNLSMFDGENVDTNTNANAEGGDGTQGAENGNDTTTTSTSVNPETNAGFISQLKAWINGMSDSGESNQSDSNPNDSRENDNGVYNDNRNDESIKEHNERIAGLERRERIADMRDAGVSPEMMNDAMSLFEHSEETDVNKFLEKRAYLKGAKAIEEEEQKKPETVKKDNLSEKEKYLQKLGYLK